MSRINREKECPRCGVKESEHRTKYQKGLPKGRKVKTSEYDCCLNCGIHFNIYIYPPHVGRLK